MNQLIER